jgi:DNA-directed RNA polymerase specialized sigma24 family protein
MLFSLLGMPLAWLQLSVRIFTMPEVRDTKTPFPATRWTLVRRVRAGGSHGSQALEELCQAYWFPLYGWARRSGVQPADAEDLVQGFFGHAMRKQLFERADKEKGRLRTFLLTAFRRYHRDVHDKAVALRRGGDRVVSFDAAAGEEWYQTEAATSANADAFYDRQWALAVLERVMNRLAADYAGRGKTRDFEQLRRYLSCDEDADYERDAEILGLSPGAIKTAVHRMRARFGEALREEIAFMQDESENVDDELAHLLRALEA